MSEPLGLAGYAAGDFLEIAGDVGEFDPKAADPIRQLIDQTLAVGGNGDDSFPVHGLRKRHRCIPLGEQTL
jgi:hypothetical protein